MTNLPAELMGVITASEAAYSWGMSVKAIHIAIWRGDIPGRKSKGTWLTTVQGMVQWKGKPSLPLRDWEVD
jgi:hypothetical protein